MPQRSSRRYDLPSWVVIGLRDGSIERLEWDSSVDHVYLVLLPLAHPDDYKSAVWDDIDDNGQTQWEFDPEYVDYIYGRASSYAGLYARKYHAGGGMSWLITVTSAVPQNTFRGMVHNSGA